MVKAAWMVVFAVVASAALAQEAAPGEKKGPVLYGDGAGRLWKWEGGEKSFLSPEGQNLVLGGVGDKQLWGWAVAGDRARFFTLELPKKKPAEGAKDAAKPVPASAPVFDPGAYPVPDRADRLGERLLLVYGALTGHPRYEVWASGVRTAARAWDDGRTVLALSLGPGWLVAGRDRAGAPWLEVSGTPVDAPEGWRGRLTVALWSASDDKGPLMPRAAGWGAPEGQPPRPLFWSAEGWSQPTPDPDAPETSAGTYPVLGAAAKAGALALAGWRADEGTGALRPWFWDGQAAKVPGGVAEGLPQAFGSGKGGTFLIVRHQSSPWFTREDGKESQVLEGLGADDRVVAVEADGPKSPLP